jgi:hypothetical protein
VIKFALLKGVRPVVWWPALACAAVLIGAFGLGQPAHANLVQNGNFTLTTLSSPGGYVCNTVGPTCTSTVSDWNATCSSTGVCGNGGTPLSLLFAGTGGSAFNGGIGLETPAPDSPAGGNFIGDDGDIIYRAPLFQTISGLTAGKTYDLTFYQAADQQAGIATPTTEQWEVSLGSETQFSTLISNPPGAFSGWFLQSLDFVATSASETLTFLSIGTPSGVPPIVLLANVSLTAVPEPGAWTLLIVGMAGLAGALWWRRRSVTAVAI